MIQAQGEILHVIHENICGKKIATDFLKAKTL